MRFMYPHVKMRVWTMTESQRFRMTRSVYFYPRSGLRWSSVAFATAIVLFAATVTQAQLRIVTYNTDGQAFISSSTTGNGPTDRLETVLKAIGQETGNNGKVGGTYLTDGIAKPIDVLLLQEQDLPG